MGNNYGSLFQVVPTSWAKPKFIQDDFSALTALLHGLSWSSSLILLLSFRGGISRGGLLPFSHTHAQPSHPSCKRKYHNEVKERYKKHQPTYNKDYLFVTRHCFTTV